MRPATPGTEFSRWGNLSSLSDLFGNLLFPVHSGFVGRQLDNGPIRGEHLEMRRLTADPLDELRGVFRIDEQHHALAVPEDHLKALSVRLHGQAQFADQRLQSRCNLSAELGQSSTISGDRTSVSLS